MTYKGKIKKIFNIKPSYNPNTSFIRVWIELENGQLIKTDLVPTYRNFKRWEKFLKIGNILDGLKLWDTRTVDADSEPRLIPIEQFRRNPNQESLFDLSNPKDFCKAIL